MNTRKPKQLQLAIQRLERQITETEEALNQALTRFNQRDIQGKEGHEACREAKETASAVVAEEVPNSNTHDSSDSKSQSRADTAKTHDAAAMPYSDQIPSDGDRSNLSANIEPVVTDPRNSNTSTDFKEERIQAEVPFSNQDKARIIKEARIRVDNHIKALTRYNEMKDVAMGLLQMLADYKGVRLKEILEEREVDVDE